ncbi:MAG: nuclease [Myxococcales bacterium]|nr:nuclease [Myxococcales bacterium]
MRRMTPVIFSLFLLFLSASAQAEPATLVYLNGKATPVFFNDGDSFRVLAGPLAGSKARLQGFNSLESYGAVHSWGTWHARELYVNAKLATLNARKGVWNCTSDMKRDTYGRILWDCPDLAVDQIKKGLAHAMTVTSDPASPVLLSAQKEAIDNRRGMWAHGVPEYVLTSLHSIEERPGQSQTYNRLVSSQDGHSKKWKHSNRYSECQKVCHETGACVVYVDYRRRFGTAKAKCLK